MNNAKIVFQLFIGLIFSFSISTAFAGEWVVKKGDDLSRIASYYPGVTAGEICRANSHMFKVKGCEHIEPGWVLVIPEVGDCFDATMTVAMKQKIFDEWDRQVVSNYQDGKPDCDFDELNQITEKKDATPVVLNLTMTDVGLSDRLSLLEDIVVDHVNSGPKISIFATVGDDRTFGLGGMVFYSSGSILSYQFSDGDNGRANELLFGKYFYQDFAWALGPKILNDDKNNSEALGVKASLLYIPEITESIYAFIELGVSEMRVKESQINGSPELALNESTLSLTTPVLREEDSYWDSNFSVSVGVGYKF